MSKASSKHIVIATSTAVVVGAFGAGAFALAQADPNFNPENYVSAYSKGLDDAQRGYQANPIDTDADANRNKENADNHDNATEGEKKSQDAFSSTPQEGPSGTTAYNLTGNTEQGELTIANGNGNANSNNGGGSNTNANTANGPVVAPTGGNGNANNNNAGNNNAGNNNAGNNGNAGDNGGNAQPPAPSVDPWQPSYIDPIAPELPFDPVLDRKPSYGMESDPINDSNKKLSDIDQNDIHVTIEKTNNTSYQLYTGQILDDWTTFCGLSAYFSYVEYENGKPLFNSAEWRCSKEQFDTYPYFKIISHPEVVPNEAFIITVAYRITTADEWTEATITYEPAQSRTYILSTTLDEYGNNTVLFSYPDNDINLFSCNNSLMRNTGYLQDDGTLTHLLLSWQEDGQDVDFFFQPTGTGRHLISPGRFVDVPDGFSVKLKNVWMDPGYSNAPLLGSKPCSLQTLTAVSPSASCMLLPDRSGRITLSTSPGIQAINIEAVPVTVDRLEIGDSVWYINANDLLRVNDSYFVNDDNPNYASLANGILTDKQETEYLGIPLSFKTLDVPEGIQNVSITASNKLEHVTLNAISDDEIPTGTWENLHNCNVLVNDEIFNEFATTYKDAFDISTGNTISMKSDPKTKYCFSNNALIANDKAVSFTDTGVSLVRVTDAHTFTTGCLQDCPSITTLVLTDDDPYFLDNGCFAASNVRTIVCSTQEQYDYVISRLQASGASNDVYVTVAVTSDEGYRYFDSIDYDSIFDWGIPITTVFEVPDSTRTFNGVGHVDGYGVAFSAIAPATFQNHPNLTWANLADSVDNIGADAFNGCSKLQGLFISNTNAITVGENAFANCASVRFIASNAATGNFASNERPNDSCLMYAPTYTYGYYNWNFVSFTPKSGVYEFAVDEQEDGSLVLSGCDKEDNRWLLLATGNEMNGEVKLSPDVIEICSSAFADTKGTFTINWNELPNLQYVDAAAFARSGLSGDVYLGSYWAADGQLGDQAFSSCSGITSFTSETGSFAIGNLAFEDCSNLEHVTLGIMGNNDNGVWPGVFSSCPKLQDITFTGYYPVNLTMYTEGAPYQFDSSKTFEEEETTLHLNVPEWAADTYLRSWLYPMAGGSDYKAYYKIVYNELLEENEDIVPDDIMVRQRMSEKLLHVENHLRTMMGLPLVEESSFLKVEESDGYTFIMQDDKYALISAPADATVVDFNKIIPDGIDTVGIDAKAFANCKNLERVILNDRVDFIYSEAFAKCDDVIIELPETVNAQLKGGDEYYPFTFGANVRLEVPEGSVNDYLAAWPMQCLGVEYEWGMYTYAELVMINGWVGYNRELPAFDEYYEAVNSPLMEQENYLRGLMGLDLIETIDQLAYSYDPTAVYKFYQKTYTPEPEPELPDLPDWPDIDWGDSDWDDLSLDNAAAAEGEGDQGAQGADNNVAAKEEGGEAGVSASADVAGAASDAAAGDASDTAPATESDAASSASLSAIESKSEQATEQPVPLAETSA